MGSISMWINKYVEERKGHGETDDEVIATIMEAYATTAKKSVTLAGCEQVIRKVLEWSPTKN